MLTLVGLLFSFFSLISIAYHEGRTRGMSHFGLAIYIKTYVKAKEELWKLKIFQTSKNIVFQKSSERNRNPSRYYNPITNLKFQHKPKYHLFPSSHMFP
jgi:hypothetical protein